ncbi:histidine protein kinase 1 [[Candida] jaroonii]|uniref:Histidine protein kinase 1 n=1 Tax=[Candida] jaroonii TaxID=467808 RepID=A0ACA9Y7M8_9ASCO|nr:histidine protein kinase 1 [[Candida] jaroonii]
MKGSSDSEQELFTSTNTSNTELEGKPMESTSGSSVDSNIEEVFPIASKAKGPNMKNVSHQMDDEKPQILDGLMEQNDGRVGYDFKLDNFDSFLKDIDRPFDLPTKEESRPDKAHNKELFINLLKEEHNIDLTHRLTSSFLMKSMIYYGTDTVSGKNYVVKLGYDLKDTKFSHSMINEWYVLSGKNSFRTSAINKISDDHFKTPRTLPLNVKGIGYPLKVLNLQNGDSKRAALIYDNTKDYITIRKYYNLDSPKVFTDMDSAPSINSNGSFTNNMNNFPSSFEPLSNTSMKFTRNPIETISILNDMISTLKTLSVIHDYGFVQNFLTTANILKSTKIPDDVLIAGFEHSFAVQREDCTSSHRRSMATDFPENFTFMSPESLSDSGKGSDFQSDFYSFGVVLYELFVGKVPFSHDNPAKLIKMHLNHKPIQPILLANISQDLNDIIMKLLEKDPLARYSNCETLINDLIDVKNQYLDDLNLLSLPHLNHEYPSFDTTKILVRSETYESPFSDIDSARPILFPSKVYGRSEEYKKIIDTYNNMGIGLSSVLIHGYPGSGKTTLFHDLMEVVSGKGEFYCYFKYNMFNGTGGIYHSFINGLRSILRQILDSSREVIEKWRHYMISNIPIDLNVLLDLMPEFSALLGSKYSTIIKSPPARNKDNHPQQKNSANGEDTFDLELRVRYLIKSLYGLFAINGLTVFLDDVQFATIGEWRMYAEILDFLDSGDVKGNHSFKLFLTFENCDNIVVPIDDVKKYLGRYNGLMETFELGPIGFESFSEFWKQCTVYRDESIIRNKKKAPTSFDSMAPDPLEKEDDGFVDEHFISFTRELYDSCKGNVLVCETGISHLYWNDKAHYQPSRGLIEGSWMFDEVVDTKDCSPIDRVMIPIKKKLHGLPNECKELLKLVSVLANSDFNLYELQVVSGLEMKEIFSLLTVCINYRIVTPTSVSYKFPFHLTNPASQSPDLDDFPIDIPSEIIMELCKDTTFSFYHDSIRRCIYNELIQKEELSKINFTIAMNYHRAFLRGQLSNDNISKYLLMGKHFSQAIDPNFGPGLVPQVLELSEDEIRAIYLNVFIESGKNALVTYNFEDSVNFFNDALKFIPKLDTTLRLKNLITIAQLYFSLDDHKKCLSVINSIQQEYQYNDLVFLNTKIHCLISLRKYQETIDVAIKGLKLLNIEISLDEEECNEISLKYSNQLPLTISEIRDLKNLSRTTNSDITNVYEMISDLIQPTYNGTQLYLKDALAYQLVSLMRKYGTSGHCAIPLIHIANNKAKTGDRSKFLRAVEYVKVAMDLLESDESITYSYIQSVYELYLSTMACFIEPVNMLLKYSEIFLSSTRNFFKTNAGLRDMITGFSRVHLMYFCGQSFYEIAKSLSKQEHDYYMVINEEFRDLQALGIKMYKGLATIEEYNTLIEAEPRSIDYLYVANLIKVGHSMDIERYDDCMDIILNRMEHFNEFIPNTITHPEYYFCVAVCIGSFHKLNKKFDREVIISLRDKVKNFFNLWAEVCPINFKCKFLLTKVLMDFDEEIPSMSKLDMFEEAIEHAKRYGHWYGVAWGYERCANWLMEINSNSRRIPHFAKNAIYYGKVLGMTVRNSFIEKKYAEYLKKYNWAGIDDFDDHENLNSNDTLESMIDLSAFKGEAENGDMKDFIKKFEKDKAAFKFDINCFAKSPTPIYKKLNNFFARDIKYFPAPMEVKSKEQELKVKLSEEFEYENDDIDLNQAVKSCLAISESSTNEIILIRLLQSCIRFSEVDYGVVVIIEDDDEPFIQAIGSPSNIYNLYNEPLSSRSDLCPRSVVNYVIQTEEILNRDEDELFFQNRFSEDEYYSNNNCYSMICIPLKNNNGKTSGALYLESQKRKSVTKINPMKSFFNSKKRDLINLLCCQATVSLTKIDLYSQMENAKRIAEDATAEKASFLANMSHEIRTPFNSLLSCSIFLLDTDLDKTQREYVETIRNSSMVTLNIIDGILAFSKIEHGSFTLANEPFSLIDSVENAIQLVGEQAIINNLELVFFNRCPKIKHIFGDETRFRQIIINLVGNAVKFTNEGHIIVEVSGKPIIGNRFEIAISVKDTGIGIPKNSTSKVFGAFSQVDSSSRRIYGGSGLGLAISKKLADLMGGTLTFDSIEGKGSTFYFVVNAEVELIQEPEIKYIREVNKETGDEEPLSTVMVDYHQLTSQSLKESLKWFGFDVDIVTEVDDLSESAVQGLKSIFIHIDLYDEFLEKFKPVIGNNEIKVILISQFGKSLPKEIDDNNIFSILLVPFQKPKIMELIRNLNNVGGNVIESQEEPKNDELFAEKYPLKILIAEDNLINLRVALQHLKKLGYQADHAKDGVEVINKCLDKLKNQDYYDVILMDIQMPRKDGITATIELKDLFNNNNKQSYLPEIVALTANVAGEDRQRSLDCGMIDFVSKPILPVNLMTVLKKVGQRRLDVQ